MQRTKLLENLATLNASLLQLGINSIITLTNPITFNETQTCYNTVADRLKYYSAQSARLVECSLIQFEQPTEITQLELANNSLQQRNYNQKYSGRAIAQSDWYLLATKSRKIQNQRIA